jgi:IMP and pyridine-specific 5'-nucleotidase
VRRPPRPAGAGDAEGSRRRQYVLSLIHHPKFKFTYYLLVKQRRRKKKKEARADFPTPVVPTDPSRSIARESLEETVLVVQKVLELSPVGRAGRVPFCAFNGGRDVFVDIGDKSWGVRVCQTWFGGVRGENTLHVGDQFLSAGANDFRARSVGTTAWIASPAETVELLDELAGYMGKKMS